MIVLITWNKFDKEINKKLENGTQLEEVFSTTTIHPKIDVAWMFQTIDTFYYKKKHETKRKRPSQPLIDHITFTQWWRKSLAYWCRHPNTFMVKRIYTSPRCQLWYISSFTWVVIVVITLWKMVIHEIISIQVGLAMTTLARTWTSFKVNKISTHQHKD